MKLYNNHQSTRFSLLSKQTPSRKSFSNKISSQKPNKKTSRPYRFAKFYQKQQQRKKHQKEHEEYLLKLRQEAFADLQLQLQHYNDEFINRMRCMENNRDESHLLASPSTDSLSSTSSSSSSSDNAEIMHDLVELFEAGTVKDYTPLIEWELCKNPPAYFESQGEYGDLW